MVERSFAHILNRGGMRRAWLRGRDNVHKRYLIHVAGFTSAFRCARCSETEPRGRPRAPEARSCSSFKPILRWRLPSSRPSTAKPQCSSSSSRLRSLDQKGLMNPLILKMAQFRHFLALQRESKGTKTRLLELTHTTTRCRVLPVAGIKLGIGRRLCVASDAEQRSEGVERVEAPVEPKREFVEVGL